MPKSTTEIAKMDRYLSAILAWRKYVDDIYGGFAKFNEAGGAGTMLYACETWLASGAGDQQTRKRVTKIKGEIEEWRSSQRSLLASVADGDLPDAAS